ncbi:MAG TPA: STAS domain-containing protein [Acidimicrobiia bacterium]|nr:STAS domain-containing protein [Acidimicrobiia bacterium]
MEAPLDPEPQLEVSWEDAPGIRRVKIAGEIDLVCVEELAAALEADRSRLVVDLTEVSFLDLTGLRCLTDAAADCEVTLIPSSTVRRLLEITDTTGYFVLSGFEKP